MSLAQFLERWREGKQDEEWHDMVIHRGAASANRVLRQLELAAAPAESGALRDRRIDGTHQPQSIVQGAGAPAPSGPVESVHSSSSAMSIVNRPASFPPQYTSLPEDAKQ